MKMPFAPRLLSALYIAVCLYLGSPTWAQRPVSPTSAAISPDGTTVAWTVGRGAESTLHLTAVANPDPAKEQLIAPNGATNCSNSAPVWSPDGATLAFTSTCTSKQEKPGQEQIFLWSKATAAAKQLTHVTGNLAQASWSPDGRSIAFLFVENATRSAGATDAMKPWAGVIGEDGIEIQRVYREDVSTGKGEWMTPPNLHVYEFSWAPDSKEIAFIAANPPGENTWWIAQLYTRSLATHELEVMPSPGQQNWGRTTAYDAPRSIVDTSKLSGPLHGLQIAVPRWSPDGKRIAFIGGLMSDQGSTGGDIWVVDAKGGTPVDVTPEIDGTPTFEAWIGNDTVGFVEDRRGHIVLPDYDVTKRAMVPGSDVDLGEISVSGGAIKNSVSFTNSGVFAMVKSGYSLAPEVWAGPLNALKPITRLNAGIKPGPKVESIEWENEGFHVQGWLTYPEKYDPAKKYPLIVEVHGGPSASAGPGRQTSMWSPLGYFTLQPNPRGSFGQGEKFVQANIKDFGYGDLRDILKGMDAVEAKVSIDKGREGLTGWSYGGFMTMFAVTQTHRFKAAVAGAGISNWQSYYGENSIDQWMVPFFGATVYDDPAVYAKSSAISYIKNVTTPVLVIVGDRDGECPAPQSFEFWHALRAEGVKSQLVIYPNEGHHFKDPAHMSDRDEREVKWFEENMGKTGIRD